MIWFLKRIPLLLLIALTALVMSNCTMLGLNYASLETANKPAPVPPIDVSAIAEGSAGRGALKQAFEDTLYGPWPAGMPVSFGAWRVVDANYLDGRGTLEEAEVTVGSGDGASMFHLVVAFPNSEVPAPVVVSQTFSMNCSTFPDSPVMAPDMSPCDGSEMRGVLGFMVTNIFGTYIAKAPVARYFDAGLAYASFYAGELVPDRSGDAQAVMAGLGGPINPTGTLMAWAYGYSAALDVLEADPRIDASRMAVMGHSRHGKSALLAGIWDRRVKAVVAHQSGFAGAALSRSETGEGLARMAKTYPHWLAPGIQQRLGDLAALPVDQHELLALLAPTPVLLGNGRRDVWSDPNSTFRAAQAASAVYQAEGAGGLGDADMRSYDPTGSMAFWLRPGGHSIVSEDIDAFTAFLGAHLVKQPYPDASVQMAN
jgi:dienelactone hydrolase